jgi:hypothetical protein
MKEKQPESLRTLLTKQQSMNIGEKYDFSDDEE